MAEVRPASDIYAQFDRKPTTSTSGGLSDKNTFLQILTAQLKYQNPMEGTDTSQYLAQLAQFTTLEQMQTLNTSFAAMMGKQDILTGSMWIGKDVMVMGAQDKEPTTGKVQGFVMDADLGLLLAVNGNYYTMNQVLAVKDPGQEWAGSTDTADENADKKDDTGTNPGSTEGA